MRRLRRLIGVFTVVAVLVAQSGCALVTTRRVAIAVGKKVYEKVQDDRARNERAEQE